MEITLRAAHKLVGKITAKLDTYNLSVTTKINVWNAPLDVDLLGDMMRKERDRYATQVKNRLALVEARRAVRLAIQRANADEIDALVADRKALLDVRHVYQQGIASAGSAVLFTTDAIRMKIEAARRVEDRYGVADHLVVGVVCEEDVADMKAALARIDREIERVEDSLTTANSTTKILLDTATVRDLTSEALL